MSLPEAFARLSFAQPARARANLHLVRERLPEPVFALLPTLLGQVPDPGGALNYLERFTRDPEASGRRRVLEGFVRQPALLHYLLALFSHSRFLSETLIQQPELIAWLGRDKHLARMKSKEDLLEEYARFETSALDADPALTLARFKRREYLRITLKDILGMAELGETTLELSLLADVLLEKALERAQRELQARYGAPQTHDARGRPVAARFAVVSLGKLGGQELNYSSDVDLLFLYAGEGETAAAGAAARIANSEYFIRLAQRLLQLIAGVTPQGAVFRVDLRLRPGGGEGDLAISLPTALDYYRRQAREWELQMLLKARHSAGDAGLVRDFLRGVEPFLYRGEMHFAAVESVLNAREQFARKREAGGADRLNVKLAPGGIRDIEFLVQCLQRLYGRDDPWVRAPGTLVGLQKLYDKGYLVGRDHFRLAAAYQFLRRLEHRLQLDQGHQIHTLPDHRDALALLARRCGVRDAEELRRQLEEHMSQVRSLYERTLPRAARLPETTEFALRAPEWPALPGELSYGALLRLLQEQGSPLAAAMGAVDVPARAHKAVHRFLTAALASSATFERVGRAAAALPLAVEILRLSEPLGAMLLRQPERLAELLPLAKSHSAEAVGQLAIPLVENSAPRGGLRFVLPGRGTLADEMSALRGAFRDAVFSWGARAICGRRSVEDSLRDYTMLTEEALRAGLAVAARDLSAEPALAGFVVLALGRLGTAEMDLASDADLVFVTAEAGAQARGRALAEKFLHVVSAYTREGTLFPVDVRLRPRGSEGELVETADAFLDYFATSAQAWEAVTYLKARPVAGDFALGDRLCRDVRARLARRFCDGEAVRAALRAMRQRLEQEGNKAAAADDLKTGPGGVYDLDFLIGTAALLNGAASVAGQSLREQVDGWAAAAPLADDEREQLRQAARLLRAVDHALRLVTGRAPAAFPAGPRSEAVAELAGRWLGEEFSAATLAARLAERRHAVRAIFLRFFG